MFSDQEREFARLAVEHHYLTHGQLKALQSSCRPGEPLDATLVAHGYLTREEADELASLTTRSLPVMPAPPPPPEETPRPAFAVPGYAIQRLLSRNAQSILHAAVRESDGTEVALKVLTKGPLERYLSRAEEARTLHHPNIVKVLEAGRIGPAVYIASEFAHSVSLRDHVTGTMRLGLGEAIAILKQVAAALAEAHHWRLLHGNLKAENVLVTEAREVSVTDFGLAPPLFQVGVRLARVMAPEAWQGPSEPASDLYSCGILWFHMLTGEWPFDGQTVEEVRDLHLNKPAPLLCRRVPGLPPAAEKLLSRLTSKVPALRHAGAPDLIRELDVLEAAVPVSDE